MRDRVASSLTGLLLLLLGGLVGSLLLFLAAFT